MTLFQIKNDGSILSILKKSKQNRSTVRLKWIKGLPPAENNISLGLEAQKS